MTQGTGINVQPYDVKQICGTVSDLALQALAVARAVQAMRVPATAYARIGDAASSASEQANQAVGQTVRQLSALLRAIDDNIVTAANKSAQWDANSGRSLAALDPPVRPASAVPEPTTGTVRGGRSG